LFAMWLALVVAFDPSLQNVPNCANPMFATYWATLKDDKGHLLNRPTPYSAVGLCPAWQTKPSCCDPSIENDQRHALQVWRVEMKHRVQLLRSYLQELVSLRRTPAYKTANPAARQRFDAAVDAFKPALDSARPCITRVLAYATGMLCFACNPDWFHYVWRDRSGIVTKVNVTAGACTQLGEPCVDFAIATRNLEMAIADSSLAKAVDAAWPDLWMFGSRELLCSWAQQNIALTPLRQAMPRFGNPLSDLLQGHRPDASRRLASGQDVFLPATPAPLLPDLPPGPSVPDRAVDATADGLRVGAKIDLWMDDGLQGKVV